jgi:flagellar motor protein MotB|uniref:FlgD Ig-like domain-containing protein n=1 Tax=candidate division WOR-3 bacterium TaxID=2052148 RepID=A0A7V3RIF0_UNCW3
MNIFFILFLLAQESQKSEHEIGEEVIKGEMKFKITEPKIYLDVGLNPFLPLDSIISREQYIFDEKLYTTIDNLNTPILYLHSEYLRVPLVARFMYGSIALFIPKFEKTVSSWELVIINANGEVVRRYAQRGMPPPVISWDGRNDKGEMCNMGEVYNYVFTAFDAVGNPTRITGRAYKFNGVVYEEKGSTIIAVSSGVLFNENSASLNSESGPYIEEIANLVKERFKKEVVVYSYSESENLARARGEVILNEIAKRAVLPDKALSTAPRFIPGLLPKYSKIEIVIQ